MNKDSAPYKFLVVQDNAEDFLAILKMIRKRFDFPTIVHVPDIEHARHELAHSIFDIILLEISAKAAEGTELILEVAKMADISKVMVISASKHKHRERDILALGVADYLLKESMGSRLFYKSIVHAVQRNKILLSLKETQKQYDELFHLSPLPMWIYNVETLRFRAVNKAAIRHYGYTRKEFEKMTLRDIRPPEDVRLLEKAIEFVKSHDMLFSRGTYRHQKKNGDIIVVEIVSNIIYFDNVKYELVLANDITEQIRYIKDIEDKNRTLQDIAFMQSHIVRAPLTNMMGILHLIKELDLKSEEGEQLLEHFMTCGKQLDRSIHEIVERTNR
ncbi:PAS domain S-box protein [Sphingobacterium siyangense]|uniref:PAS domain S-box protein n=1 Tax=Sphingobacterium siyangense TaxID=459529 RepID=UPI001964F696|nr:PAS domain S-box protein [Sphingobacterium siyangense]QRY55502.1 PAS domain S-box protein [Sphingobacterium siyangense]